MKSYKEYANYREVPVDIPGLDPDMKVELEKKIQEFEENHLDDVLNGGAGFVPKIRKGDWIGAAAVQVVLIIYYIWAMVS